ncbi:O-antigen ligase family protein [Streptomyces sp. TRM 70361]|uniref:O-antigen ligase family protein n=1 Tax=Streptomyces sp. TRM 70361 TaxID=3116553 RepID=UPI002E7BA77A|nr:O-antigen ligase family protein [Streptomyces sp. TRM 70361]MEE1940787.1 O-antigen ligase family protein [Streptomyces sp. TRM 70361]
MSVAPERNGSPHAVGTAVLSCWVGWVLICAAGRDARPEGLLLAVLAVTAGYACGRIGGSLLPAALPAGAAVAGPVIVLASGYSPLGVPYATGPDGRMGADAALLALSAGAACCAAHSARTGPARRLLHLLALAIAVAAPVLGSPAGGAAAFGVLLFSLTAGRAHRRLPVLAVLAAVAAAASAAVWVVADDTAPPGLRPVENVLEDRLGTYRVGLWEDALALAAADPVRGAGPDRFGELSPTAAQDPAADGKPHSAPLQLAAEQGLPGVLLLGGAFGWLLLALYRSPRPTPAVLVAGASLTALAVLASAGNALSFNQVTVGAGLLAGVATAHRPSEGGLP